jgi:hypothetical protein
MRIRSFLFIGGNLHRKRQQVRESAKFVKHAVPVKESASTRTYFSNKREVVDPAKSKARDETYRREVIRSSCGHEVTYFAEVSLSAADALDLLVRG